MLEYRRICLANLLKIVSICETMPWQELINHFMVLRSSLLGHSNKMFSFWSPFFLKIYKINYYYYYVWQKGLYIAQPRVAAMGVRRC